MEKIDSKTKIRRKQVVFVGMSGGVDSSVAALLLKRQGYEVIGVFMRCYNVDGCADRDSEDARRVAEKLGIPFYVWDFEEEYKQRVVKYMIEGYRKGLTPNPDVMCNREIKFGLFLDRALRLGADYAATGHYVVKREARRAKRGGKSVSGFTLQVSRDKNKDQSYFLWTLTQAQLAHCLFPVGEYTKPQVRAIARRAGLPTAAKKDSQGICFLGQVSLTDFLKQYLPPKRGPVLDLAGNRIGEHAGAHFYTVGQRHIGLPNRKALIADRGNIARAYVAEKDIRKNTIVVAEGADNPALYQSTVWLAGLNLIDPEVLKKLRAAQSPLRVFARVRYRQPLTRAKLQASGSKSQTWKLVFDEPQKFVAAGQSAVIYVEDPSAGSGRSRLRMLGGGVIV